LKASIEGQIESELVEIEPQASFLVSNEDVYGVDTERGIVSIRTGGGTILPKGRRRAAHGWDYRIAVAAREKRKSAAGEKA
jgi:hypothetical protein